MISSKLLLMRHAKSDWNDRSLSDHQRPLNRRGTRDVPATADWIASRGAVPDLILCSTAVRTRQTTGLLIDRWSQTSDDKSTQSDQFRIDSVRVEFSDSLYLCGAETLFQLINDRSDSAQRLMVVAHNPSMSSLVSHLAGQAIEMPTAAVAIFTGHDDKYVLESWTRPKTLPGSVSVADDTDPPSQDASPPC